MLRVNHRYHFANRAAVINYFVCVFQKEAHQNTNNNIEVNSKVFIWQSYIGFVICIQITNEIFADLIRIILSSVNKTVFFYLSAKKKSASSKLFGKKMWRRFIFTSKHSFMLFSSRILFHFIVWFFFFFWSQEWLFSEC